MRTQNKPKDAEKAEDCKYFSDYAICKIDKKDCALKICGTYCSDYEKP